MALFIHEAVDDKLNKKTTVIPKQIHDLALQVKGEYANNKTQDGYKTINRLLDSSYNKGKKNENGISSKEDKSPKLDKNDGLVKFPTSAARKMIVDLKKQKNFINPKAKQTIINYLQSDVKAKESAVKDNNNVPKVPKVAKPADIQKAVDPKRIKIGKTNITVSESKKIVISENKLLLLKEYYRQLNLPFNHDTENYDYKNNWEHYIDFLEYIGKYGTLPKSQMTKNEVINTVYNCVPNAINDTLSSYSEACQESFINDIIDNDLVKDYFDIENEDQYEYIIEHIKETDPETVIKYLNYQGDIAYQEYTKNYYTEQMEMHGFPYSLRYDSRGLIFVERAIDIPYFHERVELNDFMKKYRSVGECWTWCEGNGRAYCGHGGVTIKLKGWVDPVEVDWGETTLLNMYPLNDEMELRIPSAKVEVFSVTVFDCQLGKDLNLPLQKSIIVEA